MRDPWQRRPAVLTSPALVRRRLQTAQHPVGDLLKMDTAASRPWIRPVNSCPSSQQVSELSHNHFLLACQNAKAISQSEICILSVNGFPVANKQAHNEMYKIQGLILIAWAQCLSSVRKPCLCEDQKLGFQNFSCYLCFPQTELKQSGRNIKGAADSKVKT